jgi:hypothetical protein
MQPVWKDITITYKLPIGELTPEICYSFGTITIHPKYNHYPSEKFFGCNQLTNVSSGRSTSDVGLLRQPETEQLRLPLKHITDLALPLPLPAPSEQKEEDT